MTRRTEPAFLYSPASSSRWTRIAIAAAQADCLSHCPRGKPPKLRVRHAVLSSDGVEFSRRQVADKLPGAPLFTEDGGVSAIHSIGASGKARST
jgi:hypothetical protein